MTMGSTSVQDQPVPWGRLATSHVAKPMGVALQMLLGVILTVGCGTQYQLTNVDSAASPSFVVQLRADKLNYAPWEEVRVEALVTYTGPDDTTTLPCGLTVAFGVRQLTGDIALGGPSALPLTCERVRLSRGAEEIVSYSGVGHGYSMSDPRTSIYQRMYESLPCCLRLPEGVWRISSWFASDGPDAPLAAEVTVNVLSAAAI
jgi:hypothetical protein